VFFFMVFIFLASTFNIISIDQELMCSIRFQPCICNKWKLIRILYAKSRRTHFKICAFAFCSASFHVLSNIFNLRSRSVQTLCFKIQYLLNSFLIWSLNMYPGTTLKSSIFAACARFLFLQVSVHVSQYNDTGTAIVLHNFNLVSFTVLCTVPQRCWNLNSWHAHQWRKAADRRTLVDRGLISRTKN
jgi:hypothetical protein